MLTDVDLLCRTYIPRWFAASTLDAGSIAAYYADSRKREVEARSLSWANSQREIGTDDSLYRALRDRFTR